MPAPENAKVVALRPRGAEPSLAPMLTLTASAMNSVNAVILERMQSEIPLIPALAGHLIAGGGKRLRPMLTLAGAALCEYQGGRHHKLAAAVEFIHTATLLHDDVVDGSKMRRGKEAANIVYGNPATVLVGDFLFSRAFELMVEDGSLKVLKILSRASAVIAEGEVDQLTAQRQVETSEERYLSIIGAKTASLFAAATRIGAVVAERSEAEEAALEAYGRNLGIAFQLVDDAIDGQGPRRRLPRGQDDLAGDPRLCPRRRGRARLLARGDRRLHDRGRGLRSCLGADRPPRCGLRHPRAGPALRPACNRRHRGLPGERGQGGDGRGGGIRGGAPVLSWRTAARKIFCSPLVHMEQSRYTGVG
jgi:octaprenyl-diphosphate synthase